MMTMNRNAGTEVQPNCPNCKNRLLPSKFPGTKFWCKNYKSCGFKGIKSDKSQPAVAYKPIEPMMTPSPEQAKVIKAAKESNENIMIRALAGTGKTTVLVQMVREFKLRHLKTLCIAFTRRDRLALQEKTSANCDVHTNNSAGLKIMSAYARGEGCKRFVTDQDYVYNLLMDTLKSDGLIDSEGKFEKGTSGIVRHVLNLVSKARTTLVLRKGVKDAPTPQDWTDLILRFASEVKPEQMENVLHYAKVMFTKLCDLKLMLKNGKMDFDGMVFLPSYYNIKSKELYDRILVDECQDQSYVNRRIVELFLAPGGRIVAVGDDNQAIYGWRGADSESMNEMRKLMESIGKIEEYPLTLCRRCSKAPMADAQLLVPDIKCLDNAPQGETVYWSDPVKEFIPELMIRKTGLVLCRANAPLFGMCLELLKNRIPAVMMKSDVISQLNMLIDNCSENDDECSASKVLENLQEWIADKRMKLSSRQNAAELMVVVEDKAACIQVLAEERDVKTAFDLKRKLQSMFPDGDFTPDPDKKVVFSTVHGAKGNESNDVYLYSPVKEKAESLWDAIWSDARDRDNVLYVAITRVKMRLHYVGVPPTLQPLSAIAEVANTPIVPLLPPEKMEKKMTKKPAVKKEKLKK